MNHALARLKRASSSAASGSSSYSGSHASSSQLGSGVDANGNVLPAYSSNSNNGQAGRSSTSGTALLPIAEKTLPPGAAAYSHPSTQWDQARRERDELDRAIKLSEEQDQYEAALRASQQAEEAENEAKRQELEKEDEILRLSQADHEAHEDQLAIIQAEEEEAILKAIRESEREAREAATGNSIVSKGKQRTRRSSSGRGPINRGGDPHLASTEDADDEAQGSQGPVKEQVEGDEDLRKAMELSMLDQEDERLQQEALLEEAQQKRNSSSSVSAQASTSALSPATPSSPSSSVHPTSPPRPGRAPPPPPHLLPPRPGQQQQRQQQQQQQPQVSSPSHIEDRSPLQTNGPALPPRRRLSDDSAYQSIAEAPPPAYEASSTSNTTNAPSMSQAQSIGQQSQHNNNTSPAPSSSAETGTGAWQTAHSSETALEEARALEEKRQVFYPPVATSEMAEGSMRAFVPHMLFAARRRERSDPDEWLPMASRDVDLSQLTAQPQSQSPSSPTSQNRPTSNRPRRPLPPLPVQTGAGVSAEPSALSQLDQKVAFISPVSTTSPSYYTASIPPSKTSAMAPSTTRAVENVEYDEDEDDNDPFDDSRAASADEEYIRPGSDTDEYYNDHPSHTMHERHPQHTDSSSSQMNNISHAGSSEMTAESGQTSTESTEADNADASTPTRQVGRYDYAPTRSREDVSHLPRAHSPQPMDGQQRVDSEQRDLAAGEGYMSGESAVSWESTGSEDEGANYAHGRGVTDESAQDINTNISFGFNPLSSPNAHLDWQGRFPDLIVLSRFADKDPRAAVNRDEGTSSPPQNKDDYRTFAFEAPTWRELLAYLMWHGNAIFEAASRDKETSTPDSLRVSLILEFVKTSNPPSTLVRLQIHLLSTSAEAADTGNTPGARGVALSRQPLSSRPANYIRSTLPWQQPTNKDSTHIVLAFPKPYHTLPFTLGTIGTHLHNAHKAAVAQHTQQTDHRIQLGDKGRINSTQFLTDLLRGIDLCSDQTLSSSSQSRQRSNNAAQSTDGHASPDDSRFDRLVGRLREKRHNMRGTLRELHKGSRSRRRRKQQAKDKGKGRLGGRAEDSDESYLESQPQAEDYHITPYPVNS